jgi:hypothetical protein
MPAGQAVAVRVVLSRRLQSPPPGGRRLDRCLRLLDNHFRLNKRHHAADVIRHRFGRGDRGGFLGRQ